ncbi:acetylserotonin O-methyltransferase [Jidongwangia harbinensis]|uniref:acetylserotonin O-methyltransferase n=1 Tax=Jidongwangia harbinensis TaxID=2878561 RepID=UPI001CD92A86|nr:acetylserotonin O-methyltransferase [Jidongwangia harbinensis]MCA2211518.1 acetylserotonin O-methyltransferase [Jidongwangia harbinensis]
MPLSGSLPAPSALEAETARNTDVLFQLLTGHWVAQTVRAVAELRVVDHVASGADSPGAIADREGSDPATTYRLMRAGAALGLLTVHDGGRFRVTPLGGLLRENVPGSLRDAALVQNADGMWRAWATLPAAVRAGRTQVESAVGTDMFGYLAAHPEEGALFAKAMSNMTGLVVADTVALLDLGSARRVLDVGGANGALLLGLMRANPQIEGVLLDLPHVVEGARQAAGEAGLGDRFTAVAGDFFEEVPPADYFLLKWILHDWSDDDCLRILRTCRLSARVGARALVVEGLVGDADRPGTVALLDLNMLAMTDGRERDLAEFDALFAASGWRRTGVSPTRSLYSLIELEAV